MGKQKPLSFGEYALVAPDALKAYGRNPRTHPDSQIAQIVASITAFGFTNPLLIDEDSNIIAGHGRLDAAKRLNLASVPCIRLKGLTDAQKRALVIADNQIALNAGWDLELLSGEIKGLSDVGFDLDLTGISTDELDRLLAPKGNLGATDPDEVPEPPAKPVTQRGDVWTLGGHRLICGDCRDPADMAKLRNGSAISLAFTSPPYAQQRAYDEASGFKPIHPDEYVAWFEAVANNIATHLAHDGSWFVNIKPASADLDTSLYVNDLVAAHVRQWGWHWVTEFCWERPGVPKQVVRRFKNQFEPVFQFVRGDFKFRPDSMRTPSDSVPKARGKGAGNTSWGKHQGGGIKSIHAAGKQGQVGFEWFSPMHVEGLAYPGNRLPTFMSTHTATGHSAAFPVGLPEWFIRAYTDRGDIVLDPFAGSGSTIIAAERTDRRALGVELSPVYCDVAITRWQNFTGQTAQRDNGEPFKAAA